MRNLMRRPHLPNGGISSSAVFQAITEVDRDAALNFHSASHRGELTRLVQARRVSKSKCRVSDRQVAV